MALRWSVRRQLLYYAVFGVVAAIVVAIVYNSFFTAPPTCFDGAQNGDEHGVDCGGSVCALICQSESKPLVPLWAPRLFRTGPTTYSAALYLQNNNNGAGAKGVGYRLQLFDAKNSLVISIEHAIDVPPVLSVPIIENSIDVGSRTPVRAVLEFTTTPLWHRISGLPSLRIGNQVLSSDASTLSATIYNDSATDAKGVTVDAVLFSQDGVALAATKSIVDKVSRKGSSDVVFTFSSAPQGVSYGQITVLPSF